jgi:hypothetical protein
MRAWRAGGWSRELLGFSGLVALVQFVAFALTAANNM